MDVFYMSFIKRACELGAGGCFPELVGDYSGMIGTHPGAPAFSIAFELQTYASATMYI